MMRDYVYRSTRKPNRWMYIPDYRPRTRINIKDLLFEVCIAAPLASMLIIAIVKAAETL